MTHSTNFFPFLYIALYRLPQASTRLTPILGHPEPFSANDEGGAGYRGKARASSSSSSGSSSSSSGSSSYSSRTSCGGGGSSSSSSSSGGDSSFSRGSSNGGSHNISSSSSGGNGCPPTAPFLPRNARSLFFLFTLKRTYFGTGVSSLYCSHPKRTYF